MPDEKRERDLIRRCLMSLGNLGQDPAAPGFGTWKIVLAEGAIGHHRQTMTDAPGKDRMFDGPLFQVIKNLVAGDLFAGPSRDAVSLIEIVGVEVADTPGEDFALAFKVLKPPKPVESYPAIARHYTSMASDPYVCRALAAEGLEA